MAVKRASLLLALALLAACNGGAEPATTAGAGGPTSSLVAPTTAATSLAPTTVLTTPPPRMGHAMVSTDDGRLLVFGGRSYSGPSEFFLDDTWVYDTPTGEWSQVADTGPLARSQHAMAYDPVGNQVLLFGGYVGSSFTYGDTWLFDVAALQWRRIETEDGPSARAGSVAVFDEAAGVFVMFGGAEEPPAAELPLAETWVFDPATEQWSQQFTNQVPALLSEGHPTLFELAMVYDRATQRSVLMVAGESTWIYDASAVVWAKVDGALTQGLGADYMTAAAYDAAHRRVIAYGGAPVERTQGTWGYDTVADRWEAVDTGAPLGPIANHAMAFDPATEATYLFGGAAAVLVLSGVPPVTSEMWAFDGVDWAKR